jgi:perosamine synthetase
MIDLFKVKMDESAHEKVAKTLHSGYITQGSRVDEFEKALEGQIGPRGTHGRPVLVNSCTSAIDLALELCGVQSGDEVISTPQTCFASNVGAIHRGARIVWADIDPMTGLIDPASVGSKVTGKTKAIIAVNWAGKFADYSALRSFGIPVIEDAAHTWDTFVESREVTRGDYICYSLQAIKFLTSGDGGILFTPPSQEDRARLLRWYGLDRTKNESFRITQNIVTAGYKYNMNDIAATIGLANLDFADASVRSHRANARAMCQYIANPGIQVCEFDESASYWIFPLIVTDPLQRNAFRHYLQDNLISGALVHFRNDQYEATRQFSTGPLPGVDSFTDRQLNIPCGWWLDGQDVSYIIDVVNRWSPDA